MFYLMYKHKQAAGWLPFGQSFTTIQEADLPAIRKRFPTYLFKLQFNIKGELSDTSTTQLECP